MAQARDGASPLAQAVADYRAGKHLQVIRACRKLMAGSPRNAEAANLMGAALLARGEHDQAAAAFRRAADIAPEAGHHHNLALALGMAGDFNAAASHHTIALGLQPSHAGAMSGLGDILRQMDDLAGALHWHKQAVSAAPHRSSVHYNLALALNDMGDFSAASRSCQQAIQCQPDHAEAQFLLAELCLRAGTWQEGWARYEHRFRLNKGTERPSLLVPANLPAWNGEPVSGRAVLLIHEQGFGDAIHFIRFAPQLAARGITVDVAAPPALASILASAPGVRRVVTQTPPARAYAGWFPLASLPRLLGITPANVPAAPYLSADHGLTASWRARLDALAGGRLRVGLVWAGNPGQANDRNRSITLDHLAPLAAIPGCHFFAFQKGASAAQPPPAGMCFTPIGAEFGDFAGTAAALSALDLLISTDTSVPNLAGALGVPTWLMLGTPADWRWGEGEGPALWYPSIRRFRQPKRGDWAGLIASVAQELAALTA